MIPRLQSALHHSLLEGLSTSVDLWTLTDIDHPVAIVLLGSPSESDPQGYAAIAAHARSLPGTALTMCAYLEPSAQRTMLFPGWAAPAQIGFVIMWNGRDQCNVIGHSLSGSSIGLLERSTHPEVPIRIELTDFEAPRPAMRSSELAAHLLAVLIDSTRLAG